MVRKMEIFLLCNEERPVVAERFIKTLKNKIYKYVTSISKNVYINKLNDIVNKYSNTYHSAIKMKPVDVKSDTCTNSSQKMILNYICRISKYKKNFAKGYVPLWLVITKVKNTVLRTYVLRTSDLKHEVVGTF